MSFVWNHKSEILLKSNTTTNGSLGICATFLKQGFSKTLMNGLFVKRLQI